MLNLSKPERYFVLFVILAGILCSTFSYYQKISPAKHIKKIDIREPYLIVNINTVTATELERLPGIGPLLASNIVDHRQNVGGFKRTEDLKAVRGIGDRKFEKIKDLISISE